MCVPQSQEPVEIVGEDNDRPRAVVAHIHVYGWQERRRLFPKTREAEPQRTVTFFCAGQHAEKAQFDTLHAFEAGTEMIL